MPETQTDPSVLPPQPPVKVPVPVASHGTAPKVEVLRRNGIVQSIRVSCCCGNSVDIQCDYAEVTPTIPEDR